MRTLILALALLAVPVAPAIAASKMAKGAPAQTQASVKEGVESWTRGDYPSAIKVWRPLAIAGDADAQFNLGQAYKLGRGVPADLLQAEDWYRKAALQGHLQAEDNYGLVQFQNGKRQQALPWIEKSSARGEPRAQYLLGTALFNGDMVTKDWVRAYALMTRASASGLAPASASLGQMDRFIPLDQRQRGLALARDMELTALRPALAAGPASQPAAPRPAPSTTAVVRPIALPPSRPGTESIGADFDTPEEETMEKPRPAPPKPRPVAVAAAPKPAMKPAPRPAAIAGKGWRVQLGAFGEESRARALFTSLEGKVSGLSDLQPFLVKAGAVTRLQAGPLASAAAAEQMCSAVRAKGNACVPVAP